MKKKSAIMIKVHSSGRTRQLLLPPCPLDYTGVYYKTDLLQEFVGEKREIQTSL
jgi:hypothetical protein